jgi:hypothetical protein
MSWSQQWQCLLSSLLHGSKALVAQNRVTISSEEKKKENVTCGLKPFNVNMAAVS